MERVSSDQIRSLLESQGLSVVQVREVAGKSARFHSVPSRLHAEVRHWLETNFPVGLYSHQADAIESFLGHNDVCLATSTASGKSLTFLTAAAHLCLTEPNARVLALYPAKALIQDQLTKWKDFFGALSLSVGFIDGSVPATQRAQILSGSNAVLMTPDVAHAWLMSHLGEAEPARFLRNLRLLILDEAHIYDGVFGTNMAFFLRRLECAAAPYQIITSTATLASQTDFILKLTGRAPVVFGEEDEGCSVPKKSLLLVEGKNFDQLVKVLDVLLHRQASRFLAFADSRKMVERLVAAARRTNAVDAPEPETGDDASQSDERGVPGGYQVFPYRSGYESEDRNAIQRALGSGELKGVVSTSALELGLDIGEIDLVVLLSVPRSVKAFRQRIGRAGRKNEAVCVIVDSRGILTAQEDAFDSFLRRPAEPNWLYLENRYIQYANALCAAIELSGSPRPVRDLKPLSTLPESFISFLENELNPTATIPDDLYPLKQRAVGGPHREFPIRSDMEQNFRVKGPFQEEMGEITLSQSLREAYPGAVHYYMAKPYRVAAYKYRDGEINLKREKYLTTEPILQTMVFPRFQATFALLRGERGFIAESPLQVSERVLGFTELRGSVRTEHKYGLGSPWFQRELNRFFQTTGVCWPCENPAAVGLPAASAVLETFCQQFGVQPRDLGVGTFFSQVSPRGEGECRGVCVYDAANGSLRLTQRLMENFPDVVDAAVEDVRARNDDPAALGLSQLLDLTRAVKPDAVVGTQLGGESDDQWTVVIAPNERAMCGSGTGMKEVKVLRYRYTPQGLVYDLSPLEPGVDRYSAPARSVQPINGVTRQLRVNLVTGEEQSV